MGWMMEGKLIRFPILKSNIDNHMYNWKEKQEIEEKTEMLRKRSIQKFREPVIIGWKAYFPPSYLLTV
jgi:predicted Holliday junction resolvase-like endonuclease